jgi:hypothetical protein
VSERADTDQESSAGAGGASRCWSSLAKWRSRQAAPVRVASHSLDQTGCVARGPGEWWIRDIWVDLGLLTLARATVTLGSGELITKRQALGVLNQLGAPIEVLDDIRQRRYGDPDPASEEWLTRRADLTLTFLGPAIDRVVATYQPDDGYEPAHQLSERQ